MSSIQFGPRYLGAYPAWYVTRGDALLTDRTSLAQCCSLIHVRQVASNEPQVVFVVAQCPNRVMRLRTAAPANEKDAFCTQHYADWSQTVEEYHAFVPERNPKTHTIAEHHADIDIADLMEAYQRRVFLLRWFCATDFRGDDKHKKAIETLQNAICSRQDGAERVMVAADAYVLKVEERGGTLRTLRAEVPPLERVPPTEDVASLNPADPATAFPSLENASDEPSHFGPHGGTIDTVYFTKRTRSTHDRLPDPKRTRMDTPDVAITPASMTRQECLDFLHRAERSVTFEPSSPARSAAWKWYSVYEYKRVGVFFEGSRILIGVSRDTRAAGDNAFEVDFDTERNVEAFRRVDGVWARETPLSTYVFRVPPADGHPIVYMGADADTLRDYALSEHTHGAPPPRTAATRYDYRRV